MRAVTPRRWKLLYVALMAAFLLTAALNMLGVRAGFLTSHLADLTVPALLYVLARDHVPGAWSPFASLMRWIGRTPARAAIFFFLASTATEVSQRYWPQGVFAGRFDPWDIFAYGAGLGACWAIDRPRKE